MDRWMFGLFGKDDYSKECIKILNKETGLDSLIAQAFIEDFKNVFDEEYENTKDVNETLVFAGNKILNAFLDETISEIRISNKCRIFDKVAVKINQWALEKIDESHPLKNLIEKNIEKFTPQK